MIKEYRRIIKIGNSLGVTIPKKVLPFTAKEGDFVKITVEWIYNGKKLKLVDENE